jgi:hypothetical protein
MKITFFESRKPGRTDGAPAISVRPKGQVTLNKSAVTLLEAEAGEAATLGYDETSKRWLLAHWPNGKSGQPQLRAASANSKGSLRFQASAPTSEFYSLLPAAARGRSSVLCTLEAEPLQDEQHPNTSFWVLVLPKEVAGNGKGGNRG